MRVRGHFEKRHEGVVDVDEATEERVWEENIPATQNILCKASEVGGCKM